MAKRIIDYPQLVTNYNTMIETLEYDSMRSGGKAKLNAETLYYMHGLKKHYEEKLSTQKTAPKAVPAKKGGN